MTRLYPNKTRMDMVLRNRWKKGKSPSRREFEQSVKDVWDKLPPLWKLTIEDLLDNFELWELTIAVNISGYISYRTKSTCPNIR